MPTQTFSFTLEQALSMALLHDVDHELLLAILAITSRYAGIHKSTSTDMESEARRVISSSPKTIEDLIARFEWCHFMRFRAFSSAYDTTWIPAHEPYMSYRGRTKGEVTIEKINGSFDTKKACYDIWERQIKLLA